MILESNKIASCCLVQFLDDMLKQIRGLYGHISGLKKRLQFRIHTNIVKVDNTARRSRY